MTGQILDFIAAELSRYFSANRKWKGIVSQVRVGQLVEQDGSPVSASDNSLLLSPVEVLTDPMAKNPAGFSRLGMPAQSLPLNMRVFIMASANLPANQTVEALDAVTEVIRFFNDNPVFTRQTHPTLPSNTEKVAVQSEYQEMAVSALIWNRLKIPYRPSALFSLRFSLQFDAEK
jgi:hypothetical protein